MIPYNKKLVPYAKELRKNMTAEEKELWYNLLKNIPYPVKRQHNIENYIVDFYIPKRKTVIEIDGIQHTSSEHEKADAERDAALLKWGIRTLRYSNKNVRDNFNDVAEDILENLGLRFEDLKR